jgi:hypothetical protein
MKVSREILSKAGLLPKLQLGIKTEKGVKSTGKHTVIVLEDKIIQKPAIEAGDDGYRMRYIVEEGGVKKQYDTRLNKKGEKEPSYFVQAMAVIEPGEEITFEMKKAGIKNYIEIVRLSGGEVAKAIDEDEEDDSLVDGLKDVAEERTIE